MKQSIAASEPNTCIGIFKQKCGHTLGYWVCLQNYIDNATPNPIYFPIRIDPEDSRRRRADRPNRCIEDLLAKWIGLYFPMAQTLHTGSSTNPEGGITVFTYCIDNLISQSFFFPVMDKRSIRVFRQSSPFGADPKAAAPGFA
jgi:hypothetical protein